MISDINTATAGNAEKSNEENAKLLKVLLKHVDTLRQTEKELVVESYFRTDVNTSAPMEVDLTTVELKVVWPRYSRRCTDKRCIIIHQPPNERNSQMCNFTQDLRVVARFKDNHRITNQVVKEFLTEVFDGRGMNTLSAMFFNHNPEFLSDSLLSHRVSRQVIPQGPDSAPLGWGSLFRLIGEQGSDLLMNLSMIAKRAYTFKEKTKVPDKIWIRQMKQLVVMTFVSNYLYNNDIHMGDGGNIGGD
jgi:hypothetical protein